MSIPQFAPFPQASVRDSIPPEQWRIILDSWDSVSNLYLRLHDPDFASTVSDGGSLTAFLVSFFHELAEDPNIAQSAITLRRKAFLLLHRIWTLQAIPGALLNWTFISDVCRVFPKSGQLHTLLQGLWKRSGPVIEKSLQAPKSTLIRSLDSKKPEGAENILNRLGPLLKHAPEAGISMLTGSDFLDSLSTAYAKTPPSFQKKLVTVAYLGLAAVLEAQKPNFSLLSDHLYSLKTSAEQELKADATRKTFLADLVTNTPLLKKIRDYPTTPEATRVKNTAASLSAFQQSSFARPKRLVRRKGEKVDKGKGKADGEHVHAPLGEVHIHRMSFVSQVQDLFPDLGSGFVVKLLDEYNDNVEEVISHLLEDSLPRHLVDADRSEQLPNITATAAPRSHLTPRSTPPPSVSTWERRNVFDNDEFDRLAVDTSRLHIGRKNQKLTADQILSDRSNAPQKSAILAALAAFDSDDDERDDTYDAEDVGGLVDSTADADEANADKHEETLFKAYSSAPELFFRESDTRKGNARAALKRETGMTDEAIEGWAIMVGRDPKRLRRLEAKYATFAGQQRELVSTAYRANPEDGEEGGGQQQRGGRGGGGGAGRGRGRGRGHGGGGRGGSVAGPSDDKTTQGARRGKEAHKGSRANHNRRDQRAKKMARGGGGLPG